MKFTFLIVLTHIQFSVNGQLSYWTQETVARNKIETVSVYQKVPKTNPEYYKEPKGFMAISQTWFNSEGLVIEDACRECAICFDCDRDPTDVINKYYYNDKRLTRTETIGFEKSTSLLYYDTIKNRLLIIGFNKNNERKEVAIKYLNNDNKEILSYEIDFDNVLITEDSVIQVFLTKSITEYKKKTKNIKEFSYMVGSNIDRERFDVFNNATNVDEISRTFESLDYSHLELRKYETIYYDKVGNELKIIDEFDGKPIKEYKRDKKGLIITEFTYWPVFTAKYVYRYKFRN